MDLTDTAPETLAGMVTIGQRIAKAARSTELADATKSASTTAARHFRPCSTFTCMCCRGATATSCRWPRGCCCAETRARRPADLRDALAEIDADS